MGCNRLNDATLRLAAAAAGEGTRSEGKLPAQGGRFSHSQCMTTITRLGNEIGA